MTSLTFGTAPARLESRTYDLSVPRPPEAAPAPDPATLGRPAPVRPTALLLTLVAALMYAVGYLVAAIVVPVGAAGRWVLAAIAVGWDDAVMTMRSDERN